MWGSAWKKPTTIAGVASDLASFKKECTHVKHEQLVGLKTQESPGRHEKGKSWEFKTREAQAYPSPMAERLARCHILFMLGGGGCAAPAPTLKELREEVRDALPQDTSLPKSFLRTSG